MSSVSLCRWFENNLLKGNADKYHFLVRNSQEVSLNVNTFKIKNSDCEKLLGVKFNSKLKFDQHIADLCRTASRKINAITRVKPFINLSKRRLLMNSFFKTQFNYCPLLWKCDSRGNNRKINRLHERCLRTIYNDKQSSFNELLEKDGSVSMRERNLQVLATEMYKSSNGLSTPLMKDMFLLDVHVWFFELRSSVLALLRANGKYNSNYAIEQGDVKLHLSDVFTVGFKQN